MGRREEMMNDGKKFEFAYKKTLLIVDDERAIVNSLERLFRKEGYKILTATSGRRAAEILKYEDVGVVLSDQRMPEMTGVELLKIARAISPDTTRLVLSGYTDYNDLRSVINSGYAYKFIEKPWDDRLLIETVRDAFDVYGRTLMSNQFAEVFSNALEGIIIADENWWVQSVNPAFLDITGVEKGDVINTQFNLVQTSRPDELQGQRILKELDENDRWRGEIWRSYLGNDEICQWVSVSNVRDSMGKITQRIVLVNDVTKHKLNEEKLRYEAYHDALTKLPNRRWFNQLIDAEIEKAERDMRPFAIMTIDLNRFKDINDVFGHDAGDALLKQVAESYAATVRKSDTVARMGGDEFAVILSSIKNPVDAASVAKKLLKSCSEVTVLDKEIAVSSSIGISVYPNDGLTKDELLKHADLAMYRAKQSELQVCFYSDSMNSRAEMRVLLERELRNAISNNQFVLYYQPKVCCKTGAVLGAEALIRWAHPEKGLLYPNAFLRITEEVGLTAKLGNWVIQKVMADASYLKSEGISDLRLAINVSALQLRHHEVDKELQKSLHDFELSPVMFEVELTENFLIKSDDDDLDRLHEIQQLGVSLAIDDFGTGFSSISYLHTLPIETVKIDKSFVHSIGQTMEGASLVADMIRLAHGQGLKVVAEGVETEDQLGFLREANCDLYQGFLMSPAIPLDELIELIQMDMGQDIA